MDVYLMSAQGCCDCNNHVYLTNIAVIYCPLNTAANRHKESCKIKGMEQEEEKALATKQRTTQ